MSHKVKSDEYIKDTGFRLEVIRIRYRKAKRRQKGIILDEFCANFNYQRKYAIRVLNKTHRYRFAKHPGRKKQYEPDKLLGPLKQLWLATDQLCSKRLKSALPLWLIYFEKQTPLSADVHDSLLKMSAATIDRLLKPLRLEHPSKRGCGTRPGKMLKHQIPIKTDHWDVTQPGFMEADTVAHCGDTMRGTFVWSLTMTDIYSGWTEIRATWNKGAEGVLGQVKSIEQSLPFPLQGFDCDSGSEFLNYHLMHYFNQRKKVVQFTRSRPYRKNDNAHVEQKNWTHVRHLYHYVRIDNPAVVELMNALYSEEWSLLQNHFMPTLQLIKKTKINSKYKKIYSVPKTPYERLLECSSMIKKTKKELQKIHQGLNPFDLQRTIKLKLDHIFKQLKVTSILSQRI